MESSTISEYATLIQNEGDPIKKAQLFKNLHDEHDVPYGLLAKELEVSPAYISNYLRLLRLPSLVLDGYYAESISLTHLFILSRIKDEDGVISLYEQVLAHEMSALDLEEAVRNILYATVSEGDPIATPIKAAIIRKFKALLPDADIKVIQTRVKSKVVIEVKGNRLKTNEFLRKLSEE